MDGGALMARFYVGQPVVCVWGPERWTNPDPRYDPRHVKPVKGQKYHVTGYCPDFPAVYHYCSLRELSSPHRVHWYSEDGFEPITENQVQAIIAVATDITFDGDVGREMQPQKENEDA